MDGRASVRHMHACMFVSLWLQIKNGTWMTATGLQAQLKKWNNTSHLVVNYESGLM